jgi:hypothetical protein
MSYLAIDILSYSLLLFSLSYPSLQAAEDHSKADKSSHSHHENEGQVVSEPGTRACGEEPGTDKTYAIKIWFRRISQKKAAGFENLGFLVSILF